MEMVLLIIIWCIASITLGFVLGKAVNIVEEWEWSRANSKTTTPHVAPGADWGTWSHTTPSTRGTENHK